MKKYIVVFFILALIVSFPYILHDGVWLYQDNLYIAKTLSEVDAHLVKFLNFTQIPDYYSISFGFDSFLDNIRKISGYLPFLLISKIFQSPDIGQYILILLFLFIGSIINFNFLKIFNKGSDKGAFLGAIFITYSQFFLFFLQLPGFLFSVYGLQLFLIALDGLLTKKNKSWMYALLLSISVYLIFGYPRLLLIDSLIIFPYLIFLIYKNGFGSILKTIGFPKIILISLSILVIFVAIFTKILSGGGSGGMNSYQQFFKDTASVWSYNNNNLTSFFQSTIFTAPSTSFLNIDNNIYSLAYILISILLVAYTLFLSLKNKTVLKPIFWIITSYLIIIFFINIGKFTTYEIYTEITYNILPFLANDTGYLKYLVILCFGILISILSSVGKYYSVLIYLFLFISVSPIFSLNNYKMFGIDFSKELNPIIYNNFFSNNKSIKPSLYFPNSSSNYEDSFGIKLKDIPYPVDMYQSTNYSMLFSANPRISSSRMSELKRIVDKNNDFIDYLWLFNLKDIFVIKQVENPFIGQFDYFHIKDYVTEGNEYYEKFSSNTGLYIKDENESFTHFGINNDDSYEYFLYSPANIIRQDMGSFFSGSIDITEKPIVIDPDSFHKPQIVDAYEVPDENKNISIEYKHSAFQPTKIYAKIENLDSSRPFLLQLNQTFGMSWKVKLITKEEFEEKQCISKYREYSITQNTVCQYSPTLLDIRDTKYLSTPNVSEDHHFEGNFVGNAWLVTPEDIPEDMRGQGELYAVIIYEKQIYYVWALIISGLTFFALILLTIRESIISYRQKKYDK